MTVVTQHPRLMAHAQLPLLPQHGFGETTRRDAWWIQPLIVFIVFSSFIVYATWAAFQNAHYECGPLPLMPCSRSGTSSAYYLSPFYAPVLFGDSPHAWFGPKPGWWPGFVPFSPALLILPFPGLFRFTCYYYRGAYYKAFWQDPTNCTVGEPRTGYLGEKSFPLIMQNIHRYFLYIAVIFLFLLAYDVWLALWFTDASGRKTFGIGVGTIVLALNVTLLTFYTLGCHSMRHIVGGYLDRLAKRPVHKLAYDCSSCLNRWHMKWAWMSLFAVAFADIYVRMCSMGIWTDFRIL